MEDGASPLDADVVTGPAHDTNPESVGPRSGCLGGIGLPESHAGTECCGDRGLGDPGGWFGLPQRDLAVAATGGCIEFCAGGIPIGASSPDLVTESRIVVETANPAKATLFRKHPAASARCRGCNGSHGGPKV